MADQSSHPSDAEVSEHLRELLRSEATLPPERILAAELSVSRHRLRRSLKTLREAGDLAPAKTGRRATGEGPRSAKRMAQSTNAFEVLEMRMLLEPKLARLAALRASPSEIDRIQTLATTAPSVNPADADHDFHRAVANGARNGLATELHVLMLKVNNDARLRYSDSHADAAVIAQRVRERDAEHKLIAEAIARRDPDAAEAAMYSHLSTALTKLQGQLGLLSSSML
ncbi:FadR family transcriptional regulator [Thioclava sp. BHET1]|nr:FadR family transcriptional regulator [Thioclava sp. BHET1]